MSVVLSDTCEELAPSPPPAWSRARDLSFSPYTSTHHTYQRTSEVSAAAVLELELVAMTCKLRAEHHRSKHAVQPSSSTHFWEWNTRGVKGGDTSSSSKLHTSESVLSLASSSLLALLMSSPASAQWGREREGGREAGREAYERECSRHASSDKTTASQQPYLHGAQTSQATSFTMRAQQSAGAGARASARADEESMGGKETRYNACRRLGGGM
jgi:hypothetical protein